MAEEVKLFGGMWASLYSRRIEIALKMTGVQFEFIEEDLQNKSPLLLQYNSIHKKVPVLLHNGMPIAESLIILEYINETWPDNPILPRDPYDRAMARFWARFIDEKLIWVSWDAYRSKEEDQGKAIEEACKQLKALENELKEKEFFGGDTVGYLDIAAIMVASWFGVMQEVMKVELLTEENFPNLCQWVEKFVDCPIVKECLPHKEKMVEFIRVLLKDFLASR